MLDLSSERSVAVQTLAALGDSERELSAISEQFVRARDVYGEQRTRLGAPGADAASVQTVLQSVPAEVRYTRTT